MYIIFGFVLLWLAGCILFSAINVLIWMAKGTLREYYLGVAECVSGSCPMSDSKWHVFWEKTAMKIMANQSTIRLMLGVYIVAVASSLELSLGFLKSAADNCRDY